MDNRIGVQFYTVREYCKTLEAFEETCKKVSDMGFEIIQISAVPLGAEEMRRVMDKYNLKCVTTHRGYDDLVKDPLEVINYNKILGSDLCGIGAMPDYCRKSKEALDEFIENMNKVCKIAEENGVYIGYHNHSFEFKKIDGEYIFDRLINETNMKFILDVYWLQAGGKNPVKMIKELGKRAMAIHFKDGKVAEDWVHSALEIADVGDGNLDWDDIIEACHESGAKWALIEHDTTKEPFETLRNSREFLLTKGMK